MKNFNARKVVFLSVALSIVLVLMYIQNVFALFIYPTLNNDSESTVLTVTKPDDYMRMFINSDGNEIVRTYGKYNKLNKIFNIKNKELTYIVKEEKKYIEDYYYAGHIRYSEIKLYIYTVDGILLNEIKVKNGEKQLYYVGEMGGIIYYCEETLDKDWNNSFDLISYNINENKADIIFHKKKTL